MIYWYGTDYFIDKMLGCYYFFLDSDSMNIIGEADISNEHIKVVLLISNRLSK